MIREMNGGPAPAGPVGAPGLPPPPGPVPEYDQADAEAGKELFEMVRGGIPVYVGTRVFGLSADDPRLDKLRTPNKFLARAIDRNEAKAAVVGKLTGGWIGMTIGVIVEVGRSFMHFAGLGLQPVAPPLEVPEQPAAPSASPTPAGTDEEQPAGSFSISRLKQQAAGGK